MHITIYTQFCSSDLGIHRKTKVKINIKSRITTLLRWSIISCFLLSIRFNKNRIGKHTKIKHKKNSFMKTLTVERRSRFPNYSTFVKAHIFSEMFLKVKILNLCVVHQMLDKGGDKN